MHQNFKKVSVLDIQISSTSQAQVLSFLQKFIELASKKEKIFLTTPNPEIVIAAQKDKSLATIINKSDLALPDGVGLVWAGGGKIAERVSGTDLLQSLVATGLSKNWKFFLLGGEKGVAETAAEKLKIPATPAGGKNLKPSSRAQVEGLKIDSSEGPRLNQEGLPISLGEERKEEEVIEKINKFNPDFLFVGFGAPKQEKWISRNLSRLNVRVALTVGGAFDFISGRVPRAPLFIRKIGFEWLFRLLIQPSRIRRQLNLMFFVLKVIWSRA